MAANMGEPVERTVVGSYGDYRQAQRAVDFLADEKFPVEHVSIIGSGLKLVETVTGRLTWGRAALAGAASGLWLGLIVGLFVAVFSEGSSDWAIILSGALWGIVVGAVFSVLMYAMTRGQRDFVSHQSLRADAYDVSVDNRHADEARTVLGRLS
jgi:Na+/proline symporter